MSKEAITSCTRFELASVSKTFTSTAILILQERGLLSIDDGVRKYIPELPQYPNGPLRLRDLLQRTSPASPRLSGATVHSQGQQVSIGSAVTTLRRWAMGAARFSDRAKVRIHNTNYMLLGLIVERVAGNPSARFFASTYSLPLGM